MRAQRFDLVSREFKRDPTPTFAKLRDAGPLVRTRMPLLGEVWLAVTYESVKEILRDHETFVQEPGHAGKPRLPGLLRWMPRSFMALTKNMIGRDEPDHRRLRSLVDDAFLRQSVDAMRPRIAALADRALADWEREAVGNRGSADLIKHFARRKAPCQSDPTRHRLRPHSSARLRRLRSRSRLATPPKRVYNRIGEVPRSGFQRRVGMTMTPGNGSEVEKVSRSLWGSPLTVRKDPNYDGRSMSSNDALANACKAMFLLNRSAKGRVDPRWIYKYKELFLKELWDLGHCISATLVRSAVLKIDCPCEGRYPDCRDCEGRGAFSRQSKPYWGLRFQVDEMIYGWHLPEEQAWWARPVGDARDHEVVAEFRPVPGFSVNEAKGLVEWVCGGGLGRK